MSGVVWGQGFLKQTFKSPKMASIQILMGKAEGHLSARIISLGQCPLFQFRTRNLPVRKPPNSSRSEGGHGRLKATAAEIMLFVSS